MRWSPFATVTAAILWPTVGYRSVAIIAAALVPDLLRNPCDHQASGPRAVRGGTGLRAAQLE